MNALTQDLSGPDAVDLATASLAAARRLASGATIWCAAPVRAGLANQMAGALTARTHDGGPSISAEAVDDPVLDGLRAHAHSGDVVALFAGAGEPAVTGLRQRAAAWGLLTIWIVQGPRPEAGAADFVLSLGDMTGTSAEEQLLMLTETVADQLVEHLKDPGLVAFSEAGCDDEVCITCSDEGRLGEVVLAHPDGRAQVRTVAGLEIVDTTLVGDTQPGDLVLIHAGSVISLVEEEAR